jgi:HK97 family phage portal protein
MKPTIRQRVKAFLKPNVNPLTVPSTIPGLNNFIVKINEGITIYPFGNDQTYIESGYKKNWAVYVVVRKLVRIFSQINWYHYKIKTSERKTYWDEYLPLTKTMMGDLRARVEMKRMLTKSVDEMAITSPLSKFLAKPNRNQTGNRFRGNLLGHKLLTGEGNTWFSRPSPGTKPSEMFVIPKNNLALIKGSDPWDIAKYDILLNGGHIPQEKENVMMWIEEGYGLDSLTLNHLRGMSPLDPFLLGLQGMNEGSETLARMNKNQGVSGIAVNESMTTLPTAEQASTMRSQFDNLINNGDYAGAIAVMSGKWSFHQVGLDARALQLLDQQDKALDVVCMIYDAPVGSFKHGTTYENKPQEGKDLVYNAIAPHAFELRDGWNDKLIPEFNLDRERDVIDCDIIGLPQLQQDLKTLIDSVKDADFLTENEKRIAAGYDAIEDPNMNKIYMGSNKIPLDQLNADIGGGLDSQLNLLNE